MYKDSETLQKIRGMSDRERVTGKTECSLSDIGEERIEERQNKATICYLLSHINLCCIWQQNK